MNCPLQGYRIGQTELKWKLGLSGLEARTSSAHPRYHIPGALSTRGDSWPRVVRGPLACGPQPFESAIF